MKLERWPGPPHINTVKQYEVCCLFVEDLSLLIKTTECTKRLNEQDVWSETSENTSVTDGAINTAGSDWMCRVGRPSCPLEGKTNTDH